MDIASIRKDYKLKSLSENEVDASPIEQFASWFKEAISAKVVSVLDEAATKWGVKILRFEIKNLTPPESVRQSMEKQVTAERNRRAAKKRKEDPNPNRKGEAKFVTAEQVDALANESFAIRASLEGLHKTYYKKFKKAVGAIRAAQFVQFERFVDNAIDSRLNDSLPLIGELD